MTPTDRAALESRRIELELYRRATPEQKLAVVARLNAGLIGLKEADLKARRPDLSESERRAHVRRWWFAAAD